MGVVSKHVKLSSVGGVYGDRVNSVVVKSQIREM